VSKIGQEIIASLKEFGDALESGGPLEKHFTVRSYVVPDEPSEYDGPAIRSVRDRYGMSQGVFAKFLCVSPSTVQAWEQGRRTPARIARRLLDEMVANPDHYRARFAEMATPTVASTSAVAPMASGKSKRKAIE
jgi:DNA-binding transcriptional regulator YiaG